MGWLELINPTSLSVALAIISATLLVLFFVWARPGDGPSPARDDRDEHGLHVTLQAVDDQLDRFTQGVSDQLDSRIESLRELLGAADTAIGQLERLTSVASKSELARDDVPSALAKSGSIADPAGASYRSPLGAESHRRKPADETGRHDPAAGVTLERRYAHVYWLADSGLDAFEIATKTGMHPGEVGLVLGLRARQAGDATRPNRPNAPVPASGTPRVA